LKIGKQWNEYYTNGHYEGSMVYTIDGDSLINGERLYIQDGRKRLAK